MAIKWRTAWRAIAASLSVFAVLTAIGWFGASYFTSRHEEQVFAADYYVATYRTDLLAVAVFYGIQMLLHWLAAALGGVGDIRSRAASLMLGAAWVLILFWYVQSIFHFDLWWLDAICPAHGDPSGSDALDAEFERCRIASNIVITWFIFVPFILIVLSALTRIIVSRRRTAHG